MSSGYHHRTGGNKHLHHDIRNYRDLAPESLSDEALLELVRKNGKNDIAIREEIANLWNEEPATEWITADKKKLKKPTSPPLPERGGGRGRGRSAPPGRGEGGRGGRGSGGRSSSVNNSGRGRAGVPKPESPAPSAEIEKKVESTETVEEKSETVVVETHAPPAVQTTKSNSDAPVWGGGMSLAQKLREQEIAANSPPPPPPAAPAPPAEATTVEETPVPQEGPVSTAFAGQSKRSPRGADAGRGRGRRRAYRDHPHARPESQNSNASPEPEVQETTVEELAKEVENVSIEKEEPSVPIEDEAVSPPAETESASHNAPAISDMVISPVRPTANVSGSDNIVGSPVLKMGRWGAPIEPTEASSFQFGSFGNLGEAPSAADNDGDESPHKIASGLISSLSEPQASWGQQQLDQTSLSQSDRQSESVSASLSVWGNTQSQNDNTDDNYGGFDQQTSNTGADTAPPGLGLGLGGLDASTVVSQSNANKSNNNTRNSNRSAPGSQPRKSDMDNNMSRQPQQYYQPVPPGIQGGFGMPYYGFDMNSQPPAQSGYGSPPGNSSPGVPANNPSQPVGASSNSNNQNGPNNYNANSGNNNNAPKYPGPPGMPAQMGAPYPPYYGNPYYQQAFYYGGAQPQNFYGRGGYPPRPYGADPYGPQGYDMYGQPGQFDGVYGQMPMPPMHPQQGNDRQGGKGNKNAGGQNSQQQSAGAVGSAPGSSNANQGNHGDPQAVHSGYGMGGGYNYGRPDQGSGWAPYQAGWGGMMPFPTGPGGAGGYSQQMGGAPSQPGNNRQGGGGSYNSYGRGNGGSSANAGESSGIGSTGTGTTSAW